MGKQTLDERLKLYLSEQRGKDVSSNKLLLAASAIAGVGAIIVPPPAEAAIVYSGQLHENQVKVGQESYKVDFDADNSPEFTFNLVVEEEGEAYFQMLVGKETAKVIRSNSNPARLVSNYAISTNTKFATIGADSELAFVDSGNGGNFLGRKGFLGVAFKIDANTHYGWIQYEAESNATVGTIIDWAYEDVPGKAIKTRVSKTFEWNLFLPAIINGNKNN